MSSKKPSKKSPATTARQIAREFLLEKYERLQKDWNHELQNDSTDWVMLFHLSRPRVATNQPRSSSMNIMELAAIVTTYFILTMLALWWAANRSRHQFDRELR